ncbi:hypothetical protein [Pilimelia columellifera]|uniref:hypothetical protein n=1 Tax=Pilimelia columellifera TaxID=706574 RepID=UPI0031DDD96B
MTAVLKKVRAAEVSGTLNFEAAGDLGAKILAKLGVKIGAGLAGKKSDSTEVAPVGQKPADLLWVATAIQESGRRLIVEDFHYLDEPTQKEFAFVIKALGEYGLFFVIVGVWPTEHLLTYYNGDLDGRVENFQLSWTDDELHAVLSSGSPALGIEFADDLAASIVADSFGNVGLLQRLVERLCLDEGVDDLTWESKPRKIELGSSLSVARDHVASQMNGRYQAFADNFVRGMRRMPTGLEVYLMLLRAVTEADNRELIEGIDSLELLRRLNGMPGGNDIRQSDLTQALERVDRLQVKIAVRPPVLTYNKSSRKLFLADRSFLFYRQHANPRWPWMDDANLSNDLADQDPLLVD